MIEGLNESLKYAYRGMAERSRDLAIDSASKCLDTKKDTLEHISAHTKGIVEDWQTAMTGCDEIIGKTTGFPALNDYFRLTKNSLVVIGARPSNAKTALGVNISLGACRDGASGIFFSAEMSTKALTERTLCTAGTVRVSRSNYQRYYRIRVGIQGKERLLRICNTFP